jgi:hypothetical protein
MDTLKSITGAMSGRTDKEIQSALSQRPRRSSARLVGAGVGFVIMAGLIITGGLLAWLWPDILMSFVDHPTDAFITLLVVIVLSTLSGILIHWGLHKDLPRSAQIASSLQAGLSAS